MAQALRRRPAIEVGPQHARIAQFLGCAVQHAKPSPAIDAERAGMIERVGVDGEFVGAPRESAADRSVEQPRANTAADIGQAEAEEGELGSAAAAAIQLEETDKRTVV